MTEVIYSKPPIREAVFDVRIKFEKELGLDVFERVYEQIKTEYPKRQVNSVRFVSFEAKGMEEPKVNTGGGPNGLRLTSADGLQIVQFKNDGFTFSRLKPYTHWKAFSTEVEKLFALYLSVCAPAHVERIALRYINAIEIPEKKFELGDYFKTLPTIAPGLTQDIVEFFSRVVLIDDENKSFAAISQTTEKNNKPDITTIIFDIDVFQADLRVTPNSDDFWARIEQIRQFRTKVFQESLTDKTRALFQ